MTAGTTDPAGGNAGENGVRIERVVTSGTFSLDGGTWDVDNNVWIVGDDSEAIVVDAAHDADAIAAAVGDRRLLTLPPGTVVRTGHGDSTTIGAEAPHLQEWAARGH